MTALYDTLCYLIRGIFVDSEHRNPEKEHNPAQNELDLGFSQMEPITPKKVIKPEPSYLRKPEGCLPRKNKRI